MHRRTLATPLTPDPPTPADVEAAAGGAAEPAARGETDADPKTDWVSAEHTADPQTAIQDQPDPRLLADAMRAQLFRRIVVMVGIGLQLLSFLPGTTDIPAYRAIRFAVWVMAFGCAVSEGRKFRAAELAPWRSYALGAVYLVVAFLPFLRTR